MLCVEHNNCQYAEQPTGIFLLFIHNKVQEIQPGKAENALAGVEEETTACVSVNSHTSKQLTLTFSSYHFVFSL